MMADFQEQREKHTREHEAFKQQLSRATDLLSRERARHATCEADAAAAVQEAEQAKSRSQQQLARERRQVSEQTQQLQEIQADRDRLSSERAALQQRVASLEAQLLQLLTLQEEEKQKELGKCVLSVAYARDETQRKYEAAMQSFLVPIEEKYIIKTEVLQNPTACQFLLWVTFAGGRLPETLPRYEEFAAAAGKPQSLHCTWKHKESMCNYRSCC